MVSSFRVHHFVDIGGVFQLNVRGQSSLLNDAVDLANERLDLLEQCVLGHEWNFGHLDGLLDVHVLCSAQRKHMQTVATEELMIEEANSILLADTVHIVDDKRLDGMWCAVAVGQNLG